MDTTKSGLLALYGELSTAEAGRLFERLVRKILSDLHPYWGSRLIEVVPWSEYARRNGLSGKDTGIDLVGYDEDKGLWGIQVKYWQKRVSWNDLGSFIGSLKAYGLHRGLVVAPVGVTQEAEEKLSSADVVVLSEDALLEGVDLEALDPQNPEDARRKTPRHLRPYQEEAASKVVEGLSNEGSRGKLVMPPGTGKTLTALRIAEHLVGKGGTVLFLAPSIALLDQSIRAWEGDSVLPLRIFAVVSDRGVGKTGDDLSRLSLLHIPPTTNAEELAKAAKTPNPDALTVVFSTYQSAEVLEEAQKKYGLPPFDLILMDEAHRTATVRAGGESPFTKVHHDAYLQGKRRLYMTATPRVWEVEGKGSAKTKKPKKAGASTATLFSIDEDAAEEAGLELLVYSMDDEDIYGPVLYEYTFARAVQEGWLTDYKVVVLAMTEDVQKELATYLQGDQALTVEEALKAVGLWKVLQGEVRDEKGEPLHLEIRRAIIFNGRVRDSKALEREFSKVAQAAREGGLLQGIPKRVNIRHIDGQMSAYDRRALLDWLKEDPAPGEIRVLTNAKVLTEGIDVPALDAVAFMRPRDSVVDVVQAVGRVMRKAPGKAYGYVVLPVVVRGENEEREIEESGYRTVWQVLSALRSVDKSFEAKSRAALVSLSGGGLRQETSGGEASTAFGGSGFSSTVIMDVLLEDDALRRKVTRAVAGKLVRRLGMGRKYLETWAEDVARAARRLEKQVRAVVEKDPTARAKLENLLTALRTFINESITEDDAILMMVQHALTKPVFDALFAGLEARREDPVSKALEALFLEFRAFLERETEALKSFYEEMRLRAQGLVDEAERADFLRRLYDGFFKEAFKDVARQMGIAYTPVELVDYLVKSADELAQKHFGRGLAAPGVYVLEPFAGTGTFVTRLLHHLGSEGARGKLERKEIWANEILLLPYHILKANVESAYLSLTGEYRPFEGALLADSFHLAELFYEKGALPAIPLFPPEYAAILNRQIEDSIQVILSNPPWRAKVEREGEGRRNIEYPTIRKRVEETYVRRAKEIRVGSSKKGELFNSLYDLYIQALRMASDRIGDEGIVAFVTNNGWLEAKSARGLRACLTEEFAEVYVYDLRGNARTKGELRRKEGGNAFGEASRAGVSMLLLVKKKDHAGPGQVFRYRVGDKLSREEKLALVKAHASASGTPWEEVPLGDWVGKQSEAFSGMVPLEEVFEVRSFGVKTNRDAYAFNFSQEELKRHMGRLIDTFNDHVRKAKEGLITKENLKTAIEKDQSLIKWDGTLIPLVLKGKNYTFSEAGQVHRALYRPFVPMHLYLSRVFNNSIYQLPRIWPTPDTENLAIAVAGKGSRSFSAFATLYPTELQILGNTQLYPLYVYDPKGGLGFEVARRSNIRPKALARFQERLGSEVTPEDVFHYVYAVLSHPQYAERFAEDLRDELPRVPLPEEPEDFWALAEAGRTLLELHTGYENLEPWPLEIEEHPAAPEDPYERYRVERLRLDSKKRELRYNDWVTIRNIPAAAFQWRPGGYPPLEWIARYWKVTTKVDGPPERRIVWDPNQALREKENPRYLLDLIGKAVRVSVETQAILSRIGSVVDHVLRGPSR